MREEIFILLRANDLSPGPTHWWLFTRAQMLGLKMSGNVSGCHPSSGRPWLNPSDPIDIDSVTFKTITFHRPRWSPHHCFRADSWLATNYRQAKALTLGVKGVCVCVCGFGSVHVWTERSVCMGQRGCQRDCVLNPPTQHTHTNTHICVYDVVVSSSLSSW